MGSVCSSYYSIQGLISKISITIVSHQTSSFISLVNQIHSSVDSAGIHLQPEDFSQFSVGASIYPRPRIFIGTGWRSCCCCDYFSLHP